MQAWQCRVFLNNILSISITSTHHLIFKTKEKKDHVKSTPRSFVFFSNTLLCTALMSIYLHTSLRFILSTAVCIIIVFFKKKKVLETLILEIMIFTAIC